MFIKPATHLGVGINYRSEIMHDILQNCYQFDFIEINTERFFIEPKQIELHEICQALPVVLHGLTLSIGDKQNIQPTYLQKLKQVLTTVDCHWFSEHIAITNVEGFEIRALMPVEFTHASMRRIVKKAKQLMRMTTKPLLLENIAYYYIMPGSRMSEIEFLTSILEQADCGLLLDVNNLYVNSVNHRYDPYDFINKLPLERIVEVHLAGCDYTQDLLIDTHASSTKKEVLTLFQYLCQKTLPRAVVIERDARLEHFSELINEVHLIRNILTKYSS